MNHGLIGAQIGRLAVLYEVGRVGGKRAWLCRCECGRLRIFKTSDIYTGKTRSCGCWKGQLISIARYGQGPKERSTHRIWQGMRGRCAPNGQYGLLGIVVSDRWKIYANFLADMGPRPSRLHSIDRIDNARGYEPGNCRWATAEEQNNNRGTVRIIEAGGRRLSISQWSRELGINRRRITKEVVRRRVMKVVGDATIS